MRTAISLLMTATFVICLPGLAFSQVEVVSLDLAKLRADVQNRLLLERQRPVGPVIDHLWKSNGGAAIARDAASADARALAATLAGRIDFNADTGTIVWPVVGFADASHVRFTPSQSWDVLGPYFADPQFRVETVNGLKDRYIAAAVATPVRPDPLVPPAGLTMPADKLLSLNGFGGSGLFVYSASNCFDVAMKCYFNGFWTDARVLLSHAIAQEYDERYYYFRGMLEMLTGRAEDAKMSALGYLAAPGLPLMGNVRQFYERVNGPAAIQFRDLVGELALR